MLIRAHLHGIFSLREQSSRVVFDSNALRYLQEAIETLREALKREDDPAERNKLAEMIEDFELRIKERRIE